MFKEEKIRIKSAEDLICLIVDQLTDDKKLKDTILEDYGAKIDALIREIKLTNSKSNQFELKNNKLYLLDSYKFKDAKNEVVKRIKESIGYKEKLQYLNSVFYFLSIDIMNLSFPNGNRLICDKIKEIASFILVSNNYYYNEAVLHFTLKYAETIDNLLGSIGDNLLILKEDNMFSPQEWKEEREDKGTKKLHKYLELLPSKGSIALMDILDNYFKITIENLQSDLEDLQKHIDKIKFN